METLLPTIVGGLMAIVGGAVGRYLQSIHAAAARAAAEAREDRYRLCEQRLQAYQEFHISVGPARVAMSRLVREGRSERFDPDLLEARSGVWHAFVRLQLVGHDPVVARARDLFTYVDDVMIRGSDFDSDEWASLIRAYSRATREHVLIHESSPSRTAELDTPGSALT